MQQVDDIITEVKQLNLADTSRTSWLTFNDGTDTSGIYTNAGTPEGAISANIGSICLDTTNGIVYTKTTDTANTGWSAPATGGTIVQYVSNLNIAGSVTGAITLQDVTGASLSITPTSASNVILVKFNWNAEEGNVTSTNTFYDGAIVRDSTQISTSSRIRISSPSGTGNIGSKSRLHYETIDSPATTSAVTYKLQHLTSSASTVATSTDINIILMELAV